jgi:hypothetical protein
MIATNNKFGADALSVHVILGSATEAEMAARPWEDIQPLSRVGSAASSDDVFCAAVYNLRQWPDAFGLRRGFSHSRHITKPQF